MSVRREERKGKDALQEFAKFYPAIASSVMVMPLLWRSDNNYSEIEALLTNAIATSPRAAKRKLLAIPAMVLVASASSNDSIKEVKIPDRPPC